MKSLLTIFLILLISELHSQEIFRFKYISGEKIYNSIDEAVKNPDSVLQLNLSKQKLKKFPIEICQFKNLKVLNISKNKIDSIPDCIVNLKALERFTAADNEISFLSDSICLLSELRFLALNQNFIEKLPNDIGNLKNLEILDLWSNELSDLPESVADLSLKALDLRVIQLDAEVQYKWTDNLPNTKIFFSNSCNCKD